MFGLRRSSEKIKVVHAGIETLPHDAPLWTLRPTHNKDTNLIRDPFDHLRLYMEVLVDKSLRDAIGSFGRHYRYLANFRLVEAHDNSVRNNDLVGFLDEPYVIAASQLLYVQKVWNNAKDAGLKQENRRGLYIFSPFFVVDAMRYLDDLSGGFTTGLSEFAVSDDLFVWVESTTV